MIYLDANFFVLMNSASVKGENARRILNEIIQGKRAVTSSLALDEVMWVFMKNKLRHELRRVIEEVYSVRNLEVKEVSSLIPLRALDFIEQHNLKPRDAFHLSLMEQLGIREIVTDDSDFDNIQGITRIPL